MSLLCGNIVTSMVLPHHHQYGHGHWGSGDSTTREALRSRVLSTSQLSRKTQSPSYLPFKSPPRPNQSTHLPRQYQYLSKLLAQDPNSAVCARAYLSVEVICFTQQTLPRQNQESTCRGSGSTTMVGHQLQHRRHCHL